MTVTTFTVDDLALGGGISRSDLPLLGETLQSVLTRLDGLNAAVDAEISIKDRNSADPKTTLEVWIHGLPRLVARSGLTDERSAFADVAGKMLAQINEVTTRREPKNNRQRRDTIRPT